MKLIHKKTGKEVPIGATIFIERTTTTKGPDGKETEKKEELKYKVTKDNVNDLIRDGMLAVDMGQEEKCADEQSMMNDALHTIIDKIMRAYNNKADDKGFAMLAAITEAYPVQSLCMMLLELASAMREKEGIKKEAGEWYTMDFVDGGIMKVDIIDKNMETFGNYPLFKTPKHLKKAMDCIGLMMGL